MDALRDLRMFAIREALGEIVGADLLINAALRGVIEGVDGPSLFRLAGLTRREEGEAHGLFGAVVSELDLFPSTLHDESAARWELVRLLCEGIADGSLEPEVAGRSVWDDGWDKLDHPHALLALIGCVSEWEDWSPSWDEDRDDLRESIVGEARALVAGPWPPE